MDKMNTKVLLMDMDGVLIRHPMYAKSIQTRVHGFVKKKLDKYMPDKKVEQINKVLYREFGHTVIGMQKIYDNNISLKEFSDYVYHKEFLNNLPIVNEDEVAIKNILKIARENNTDVYIFSNAPDAWCNKVLESMNITDIPIIGCDHFIYQHSDSSNLCLKPNFITYLKVMQYINLKNTKSENTFIMVDDQIQNVLPMIDHPNWKGVWLNHDKTDYQIYTPKLYTINELDQLISFI
jgi:FMN phosphatase YigB (HAD superfamily)